MRISDWSSDVCSSDLNGEAVRSGVLRRAAPAAGDARSLLSGGAPAVGVRPTGAGERLDHGLSGHEGRGKPSQGERIVTISVLVKIGRASCRERGCTYG